MKAMKRARKNLVALGLVLFFAFGVLCASMAAPGESLAAATGCSQNSGGMAMNGCEYPIFCGSSSSSNLRIALTPPRPNNLSKYVLSVVPAEVSTDASSNDPLMLANGRADDSPLTRLKVSIHLFNSVLNL